MGVLGVLRSAHEATHAGVMLTLLRAKGFYWHGKHLRCCQHAGWNRDQERKGTLATCTLEGLRTTGMKPDTRASTLSLFR